MSSQRLASLLLLATLSLGNLLVALPAVAQQSDHSAHGTSIPLRETGKDATVLPNLSKANPSEDSSWPAPIEDSVSRGFLLFDNLEYQESEGPNALRWDILGWYGGDSERFWFKSEGRSAFAPSKEKSEVELQALYGKLIAPFFDLQAGVRVDPHVEANGNPSRVYGVLGLQGLAPYEFDVEPTLFLSERGQLSGRLTATYDILFSQRLILQPRFESSIAAGEDKSIGVSSGLNGLALESRLRYEISRRFAPYIGVAWKDTFGATRQLAQEEGEDTRQLAVVAGIRLWF